MTIGFLQGYHGFLTTFHHVVVEHVGICVNHLGLGLRTDISHMFPYIRTCGKNGKPVGKINNVTCENVMENLWVTSGF